ncbi:MAG: sulfotransferase domain-containing protein [bacterium]
MAEETAGPRASGGGERRKKPGLLDPYFPPFASPAAGAAFRHPERIDFVIAGTQKGGTTALAKFLSEHPGICIAPGKEVHFFDREPLFLGPHPDYEAYHRAFPNYRAGQAAGESTPVYMYLPQVAERLAAYNPRMKLVVLLRNPIERAYSHFIMEKSRNREPLAFAQAIRREGARLQGYRESGNRDGLARHSYVDRGRYARQLQNLYRCFPRSQVMLLASEDLSRAHARTLLEIYAFLGVEAVGPPPARQILSQSYEPMSPADRQYLREAYAQEIPALEEMLGRSLANWV